MNGGEAMWALFAQHGRLFKAIREAQALIVAGDTDAALALIVATEVD